MKAIQSLQSRFGKKDLLIEYYVRELLKLVLNKNRESTLMTIYDKLETHMRALESLGVTTDMLRCDVVSTSRIFTTRRTFTHMAEVSDTSGYCN